MEFCVKTDKHFIILFFLWIFTTTVQLTHSTPVLPWFQHQIPDVEVSRGDTILLSCKVNLPALSDLTYFVKWTKSLTDENTSFEHWERPALGEYILFNDNAQDNAAGDYSCEIYDNTTNEVPSLIARDTATVYVIRTPAEYGIIQVSIAQPMDNTRIRTGTNVTLQCVAPHVGFTFRMAWLRNGRPVGSMSDHINGQNMLESTYSFVATPADNDAVFDCSLFSPNFQDFHIRHKSDPLNVVFKPLVNLIVNQINVMQGGNTELHCDATGNPSMIIQWMFTPEQIPQRSDDGRRVVLTDLQPGIINATCTALNSEGVTYAWTLITVEVTKTSSEQFSSTTNVPFTTVPYSTSSNKLTLILVTFILTIALIVFVVISIYLVVSKSCKRKSDDQMQVLFYRNQEGSIPVPAEATGSNANNYDTTIRCSATLSSNGSMSQHAMVDRAACQGATGKPVPMARPGKGVPVQTVSVIPIPFQTCDTLELERFQAEIDHQVVQHQREGKQYSTVLPKF